MYWLRSAFKIKNKEDLIKLQKTYEGVAGEIELGDGSDIEWSTNVFSLVPKDFTGRIKCRLVGPQTVFNQCIKIKERVDPSSIQDGTRKDKLLKWAYWMDVAVKCEMKRKTDIGIEYPPFDPEVKGDDEKDISDLVLAASLSKHVEYIMPLVDCVMVANSKSSYLSLLRYEKDGSSFGISMLVYDVDDGFVSLGGDHECVNLKYLQKKTNEEE